MKISELIEKLNLTLVTNEEYDDRDIEGCYIGDLLSWVMSKAACNEAWITVQTNVNVVAVAALTDVSCVIVPDGIEVEQATVQKADMKNIVILGTGLSSYALAVEISKLI